MGAGRGGLSDEDPDLDDTSIRETIRTLDWNK